MSSDCLKSFQTIGVSGERIGIAFIFNIIDSNIVRVTTDGNHVVLCVNDNITTNIGRLLDLRLKKIYN